LDASIQFWKANNFNAWEKKEQWQREQDEVASCAICKQERHNPFIKFDVPGVLDGEIDDKKEQGKPPNELVGDDELEDGRGDDDELDDEESDEDLDLDEDLDEGFDDNNEEDDDDDLDLGETDDDDDDLDDDDDDLDDDDELGDDDDELDAEGDKEREDGAE